MNYLYIVTLKDDGGGTHYDFSDYMFIVFIAFLIFGFIFFIIKALIDAAKARKEALRELQEPIEEAPLTEIDARVLKKECFVKTYGIKMPETRKEFYITFSTFIGETKRYAVSEELYLAVDENTVGTIAIVNDEFFDFYFEK